MEPMQRLYFRVWSWCWVQNWSGSQKYVPSPMSALKVNNLFQCNYTSILCRDYYTDDIPFPHHNNFGISRLNIWYYWGRLLPSPYLAPSLMFQVNIVAVVILSTTRSAEFPNVLSMLFAVLQLAQNIRWWKWTSKVSPTHWLALIAAILLGAITVYILLYLPLFQHPPSTEPNPGFQIRSDDRMIPAVKGYQTEPTSTKEQVSAFCMPIREVLAWREW